MCRGGGSCEATSWDDAPRAEAPNAAAAVERQAARLLQVNALLAAGLTPAQLPLRVQAFVIKVLIELVSWRFQ